MMVFVLCLCMMSRWCLLFAYLEDDDLICIPILKDCICSLHVHEMMVFVLSLCMVVMMVFVVCMFLKMMIWFVYSFSKMVFVFC
jgi:hypothetical protein